VPPTDFLILNSLSFFEKARPLMESYQQTNLYLDANQAGQKFTAYALSQSPIYNDNSELYTGFEDLNDKLLNKPQKEASPLNKKRGLRI